MSSRLTNTALEILRTSAPGLKLPNYERASLGAGIVHLGVGQFHRSHMAVCTDDALAAGGDAMRPWGICGVGLMPQDEAMRNALREQDYLYTLLTRAGTGRPADDAARVVGSHVGNLFAPADPGAVVAQLADPATRIISLTVTEKGYGADLTTRELDTSQGSITAADLANPRQPSGAVGFLAAAMCARWQSGLPPPTVLSCDNIQGNGEVLRELLSQFVLQAAWGDVDAAALNRWMLEYAAFPCTMVDRITPGASSADIEYVATEYGLDDAVPVRAESFLQWVVEDNFVDDARPSWEVSDGVVFATDVEPYEMMKLRLLNASHSCLAYASLLRGHEHVHTAMNDGAVRGLVAQYMREALPTVPRVKGIELGSYCDTLLERFSNEAIADTTLRLAEDGAMKMPGFLGGAIADGLNLAGDGGDRSSVPVLPASTLAIAAWMEALVTIDGMKEPRIGELRPSASAAREAAAASPDGTDVDAVGSFLQLTMGADIAAHRGFRTALADTLRDMKREGPATMIDRKVSEMNQ